MQTIVKAHQPGRAALAVAFVVCFLSIMFCGISSMAMSVYLPVVIKDLLGGISDERVNSIGAYINSIFIFGSMFGGFAWGIICDRIGRSRSVTLSTAFYGVFTVLTGFSSSWLLVGAYRFLTGFGVGGVLVTTNILVAELWPEKRRAVALGLVSAAMPVGFIVAGALNNLLADWHQAFLTGIVPVGVALVSSFTLAETESWRNRRQPLHSTVVKNNAQLFSAYRKNLMVGSLVFGAMLIGLWAVFSWAPTWVQTIALPEHVQEQRGYTMMTLAIAGLIGSAIAGWVVNAMGLRKTLIMCFAGCFVMTFVVFRMNTAISIYTFVGLALLAIFFGISQGALSVYIPQLFPAAIRASSSGICFNVGRLFTATVVFFIGALVTFLGGYGNAIFIFSFIFLAGLIITAVTKTEYAPEPEITVAAEL